MQPKFLYFDLGKVLVDFSVEQMLRQIGAVAGIDRDAVRSGDLRRRTDAAARAGPLSSREFYEASAQPPAAGPTTRPWPAAASEIFALNLPMLPVVAQLRQAGYPMGILSNTCENHWEYCSSAVPHRGARCSPSTP